MTGKSEKMERCEYCGSRFVSPENPDPVDFTQTFTGINISTDEAKKAGKSIVLAVALGIVFLSLGAGALIFFLVSDSGIESVAQTLSTEPAFAEETQKIGGEGIGAGKFTDNRELGIDGKGTIYCADYSGERVQLFNADGSFKTQWFIPKFPVQDLCVSREGIVYISQQSRITAYEGATGKQLYQTSNGFYGTLTVLLDGSLVATVANGEMVKLDKELNETRRYDDVMTKAGAESPMTTEITADGTGNIFILDFMGKNVYHFSPELVFIDRFKTKGMMPNHLAVDAKGRLFVSSVTEINVYSEEGEPVGTFPATQVFGMAFTDDGALWTASRPYLVKYKING